MNYDTQSLIISCNKRAAARLWGKVCIPAGQRLPFFLPLHRGPLVHSRACGAHCIREGHPGSTEGGPSLQSRSCGVAVSIHRSLLWVEF